MNDVIWQLGWFGSLSLNLLINYCLSIHYATHSLVLHNFIKMSFTDLCIIENHIKGAIPILPSSIRPNGQGRPCIASWFSSFPHTRMDR